jgi:transposase
MAETRRKFDQDFKEGAVRLVGETGRPIAQVAKALASTRAPLLPACLSGHRSMINGNAIGDGWRSGASTARLVVFRNA